MDMVPEKRSWKTRQTFANFNLFHRFCRSAVRLRKRKLFSTLEAAKSVDGEKATGGVIFSYIINSVYQKI